MVTFKEMSKENTIHFIIIASIFILSILTGIFVGLNEELFALRNFTAGYMAGSLLAVIVLFAIYRSIAFFFERNATN